MKKYRRAIALFLAIGLMVLIPSGMGVSASGNTVEAKMSENIAQVLSMTGIEREEYSDQQVIDVDGQRVRQLVFDDNLKVDIDGANVKAISHFTACTNDAIVVYGEDDISETVNNIVEISDMDENYDLVGSEEFDDDYWRLNGGRYRLFRKENGGTGIFSRWRGSFSKSTKTDSRCNDML